MAVPAAAPAAAATLLLEADLPAEELRRREGLRRDLRLRRAAAASRWHLRRQDSNYSYTPGGGGAGHANDGRDGGYGYYSSTSYVRPGKGGTKFGFSDLRNGLEAGSGGGPGGSFTRVLPVHLRHVHLRLLGHNSGGARRRRRRRGEDHGERPHHGERRRRDPRERRGRRATASRTRIQRALVPATPYTNSGLEAARTSTRPHGLTPGAGGGGSGGSVHLQAGQGVRPPRQGGRQRWRRAGSAWEYSTSYDIHRRGRRRRAARSRDAGDDLPRQRRGLRGCLTVVSSSSISGGSGGHLLDGLAAR